MKLSITLVVVLLSIVVSTVVEAEEYIFKIKGDLPLIITSPHGGYKKPAGFTKRDAGCYRDGKCVWSHKECPWNEKDWYKCRAVTLRDRWTQKIAKGLRDELCKLYNGKCPTVVYSNLFRAYLDPNREINQATFQYKEVIPYYHQFHGNISEATDILQKRSKGGLVLDIHGQVRTNYTQMGYLVYKSWLNENRPKKDRSSIRGLADRLPEVPFETLLRGEGSLGDEMQKVGMDNVPNPKRPSPGNDRYFMGGYDLAEHGSKKGGKVDAIQAEVGSANREAVGKKNFTFIKNFAKAVKAFLDRYYM